MRKNLKKIATLAMAAAMAIAVVPAVPTQAAKTELIKKMNGTVTLVLHQDGLKEQKEL